MGLISFSLFAIFGIFKIFLMFLLFYITGMTFFACIFRLNYLYSFN